MPVFTLRQAAHETGLDKMKISRAIKRGDLSASRTGRGGAYEIEASELFRVFSKKGSETSRTDSKRQSETPESSNQINTLKREIEIRDEQIKQLETERRRERDQLDETIQDLRARLNGEADERKRLTLLLTDETRHGKKRRIFDWF
ncbi:MAG: hypothetical protein AAF720_06155 [Pseudomonadota bacterium]